MSPLRGPSGVTSKIKTVGIQTLEAYSAEHGWQGAQMAVCPGDGDGCRDWGDRLADAPAARRDVSGQTRKRVGQGHRLSHPAFGRRDESAGATVDRTGTGRLANARERIEAGARADVSKALPALCLETSAGDRAPAAVPTDGQIA